MTVLTFHPPTPDRIAYIADHLRAIERVELAVTDPDRTPLEALQTGVRASRWTIVAAVDGRPTAAYGVSPTLSPGLGCPWLLATDDLQQIVRREFVTRCRAEVRLMQQHFLGLANRVHRDNVLAIRWLRWLGFTVDETRPDGPMFWFWKGSVHRV